MEQEQNNIVNNKNRLFIDMDGTLAKYQPVETMEILFEQGYFFNLEPQKNVVEAIKKVIREHPEKQVYIMSSVLSDSKYALQEKNEWLDKYLPEIDKEHRIFPPCGENKLNFVPEGIRSTDFLLDDYTNNLMMWEPPAQGIKLLNGINHTNETWEGSMLRYDKEPEQLAEDIAKVMAGEGIRDKRPVEQIINMANQTYEQKIKSAYISEEVRAKLDWLTESETMAALREGLHVCRINDFPEYHGIHADEYFMAEIKTEKGVQNLYHSFGQGVIHKACVSPYYENPVEIKKMLQESKNSELKKDDEQKVKKEMRKELTI